MNKSRFTWSFVFVACSLLALPAWGGEGFSLPNLNPFAAKKKTKSTFGDDSPGATTIPSAGGVSPTNTGVKKTPAKPSSWQKLNSGTQTFFANV